MARLRKRTKHLYIPDLQVKPNTPLNHVKWVGQYIADKNPDVVINAGDMADMPSLSYYDRGKKEIEGKRYKQDVEAVHFALDLMNEYSKDGTEQWHITLGNHEERITRYANDNPSLDGHVSIEDLRYNKYYTHVHDFLVPVTIDGVIYSHYFYNPQTGRPLSGMIETRIKNVGRTFTMGHQQGLKWGQLERIGRTDYGLVAGSCYLHDEKYKGPQGNDHWRGVVLKNNVRDGQYDPTFVRLEYLCERYEGISLEQFMRNQRRWIVYKG